MEIVRKIVREPALLVGVITAGLGLAVLFGLEVTEEQTGGIVVFLGALMALVRFLTTPSAEVVVQRRPSGRVVAGAAAVAPTGTELEVAPENADDGARQVILEPVVLNAV